MVEIEDTPEKTPETASGSASASQVLSDNLDKLLLVMTENSITTCQVMKSLAEKRANETPTAREEAEDEPVMIDEDYHIKDDGVSVIDMKLRHRLATPNVDPANYWTKAGYTRVSKPRLGNNIYTEHIRWR